jgi:hypothetical protein
MWTAPTRSLSESTAEPRQMIVSGQHQFGAGLADRIIALPQDASGETAAASYLYRQPRVPRLQGGPAGFRSARPVIDNHGDFQ